VNAKIISSRRTACPPAFFLTVSLPYELYIPLPLGLFAKMRIIKAVHVEGLVMSSQSGPEWGAEKRRGRTWEWKGHLHQFPATQLHVVGR